MQKLFFTVLLGLILVVPAFALDGAVSKISGTDNRFRDNNPVAWEHTALFDRGGAGSGDLFLYDTTKKELSLIASDLVGPYHKRYSIYANKVVYQSTSGIKLKDVDAREDYIISSTGGYPSVFGDRISYINGGNIYLRNLINGSELQLNTGTVYLGGEGTGSDIYGDNVVWLEDSGLTFKVYNISNNQTKVLSINPSDLPGRGFFDLYENYLIWTNNWQVYLYDLNNDTYKMVSDSNKDQVWYASINKNKIVWDNNLNELWIGVYDIKAGIRSTVGIPTSDGWCPVTDGDKILYAPYYDAYRMLDITSPREETYSLNATANTVTVINPYKTDDPATTGIDERVVATIATGAGPSDSALSPDETKLYILNSTAKTVTVAQTYDFVPVNTVNINPTNKQTATAVAGDNDSNIYVALKSSTGAGVVKKITSTGIETILTVGVNPNGLKNSPDNKKLLVSNSSSSNVTAIDLATFTIIEGNITTGAGPKLVKP